MVTTKCPFCGKIRSDEFPEFGYNSYITGENIQNAMPDVSVDLREIIISGICPKCWDDTFKEE